MAVCHLCEIPFPSKPEDSRTHVLKDRDLYAERWAPLQDHIYCPDCIVRSLAKAVDILLRSNSQ